MSDTHTPDVLIDGISPNDHRKLYPHRWTTTARAWPYFWWSFLIVPAICVINWLTGDVWDQGDSGLAAGWIISRFLIARNPVLDGFHVKHTLDKKPLLHRLRSRIAAARGEA